MGESLRNFISSVLRSILRRKQKELEDRRQLQTDNYLIFLQTTNQKKLCGKEIICKLLIHCGNVADGIRVGHDDTIICKQKARPRLSVSELMRFKIVLRIVPSGFVITHHNSL